MFPIITSKKQKEFEKYCIRNNITSDESKCNVPCICGYYGRACRQTNDEANRMRDWDIEGSEYNPADFCIEIVEV